jgi:cytochrome c peroxidase
MEAYSKTRLLAISVVTVLCFSAAGAYGATPKEQLGRLIYFDTQLSEPAGQACVSCHDPRAGFADPDHSLPVSEGVLPGRFGGRNAPSAAYASFFPEFSYASEAVGGQFWDGRARNLKEQAKGPFLNPVEMNNPNPAEVISKIKSASYAALFEQVYGANALNNVDSAYDQVGDAIAAFEATAELNQFTSKFDRVQAGLASFTMQERQGMMLFNDRARCSQCHVVGGMMDGGTTTARALFTDFRYHNLGLPKNSDYPFNLQPPGQIDLGLGGVLGIAKENGKFKTAHLRNIALTGPYMHNGVLKTLKDVVHFYNTRDVPGLWPAAEVPQNIETRLLGNLGLSNAQEDAIVAFLMTLTDGYTPAGGGTSGGGGMMGGGGGMRR